MKSRSAAPSIRTSPRPERGEVERRPRRPDPKTTYAEPDLWRPLLLAPSRAQHDVVAAVAVEVAGAGQRVAARELVVGRGAVDPQQQGRRPGPRGRSTGAVSAAPERT